jgi:hypothetical protein
MPLTEMPPIQQEYRNTVTLTQESRYIPKAAPKSGTAYYFLINEYFMNDFKPGFYLTGSDLINSSLDRQFGLIYLTQNLFKNAKHMDGKALEIMNITSARMFSKTPTSL